MDDERHTPADAPGGDAPGGDAPGGDEETDALLAVRRALEDVDELPLEDRAAVFERTHEVVVEELRALELG